MKEFNYKISSLDGLKDILQSKEILTLRGCKSQLVQIYSAKNSSEYYQSLANAIRSVFPSAVIAGASSVGEINEGKMVTGSTIISFSFFESSSVSLFSYYCKEGNEEAMGKILVREIKSLDKEVKGLLLLSTPVSNDSSKLFNSITADAITYPIFGGGAGDYANRRKTLVFDGLQCYRQGVVAVVFSGKNLHIEPLTYLGWHPLSQEMTITGIDNMSVKTIDGKPAFSVYQKYLGIKADSNFFQNVLEFPFIFYRDGQAIARVPFLVNEEEGSIEFIADIKVGEKFKIGYGNPQTIIAESVGIQNQMKAFQPDAIFLYTCICRRFLMQQDVEFETLPFNTIAPTSGFYTFGEFFASSTYKALLNSTMVAVGFREGIKKEKNMLEEPVQSRTDRNQASDPYQNQHIRILSQLLFFINVMTKELEEQNNQLKQLNEQKNEFLGIAAHDLRSPIGVIQGFSEILEEKIDGKQKDYTKIITKVSSDMLTLLNDFLDISKIESGKLDLKKNEIDFIPFIMQNIRMNRLLSQNKGIKINVDVEIHSQIISMDSGKIDQVLNNLISNAIKYSYKNTTISIKVFKDKNQIVTQVIDQGQGIPKDEIKGIFHPFKKSSIAPTGGESSHGLGLAIVKKIIEGHNGTIGVTSTLGKGSTFYFTLPAE